MDPRSFPLASLAVPAALSTPSRTCEPGLDPVDNYWAAHHADQLDADGYIEALQNLDDWQLGTHRDFVRKFVALFEDGGMPTQDRLDKLMVQAKILSARPS